MGDENSQAGVLNFTADTVISQPVLIEFQNGEVAVMQIIEIALSAKSRQHVVMNLTDAYIEDEIARAVENWEQMVEDQPVWAVRLPIKGWVRIDAEKLPKNRVNRSRWRMKGGKLHEGT
jgi:hypothetical protein